MHLCNLHLLFTWCLLSGPQGREVVPASCWAKGARPPCRSDSDSPGLTFLSGRSQESRDLEPRALPQSFLDSWTADECPLECVSSKCGSQAYCVPGHAWRPRRHFQEGGGRGGDLCILTLTIVLLSSRRLAAYTHLMGRQVQAEACCSSPRGLGF